MQCWVGGLVGHGSAAYARVTIPIGHAESFLGAAGAALPESPGNVVYNPAGLGYLSDSHQVTANGSILYINTLKIRSKEGPWAATPELSLSSGLVSTTARVANHSLSLFIYSPGSVGTNFDLATESESSTTIVNVFGNSTSTKAGLSWAKELNPHLALGISAIIAEESQNMTILSKSAHDDGYSSFYSLSKVTTDDLNIQLGIHSKVTRDFNLGVSAELSAHPLRREGSQWSFSMSNQEQNSPPQDASMDFSPQYAAGHMITAGMAAQISPSVCILFDFLYHSTVMVTLQDGFENTFAAATDWKMGGIWTINPGNDLLIGASFSPPPKSQITTKTGLMTGGWRRRSEQTETILGAFYSLAQLRAIGPDTADSDIRYWGGMISSVFFLN